MRTMILIASALPQKKPASIATFGEEGRIENTHYLDTFFFRVTADVGW